MTQDAAQQQLKRIAREHEELIHMISSLRSWLSEVAELGIARFGEMSDRLHPLLDKLIEHFEHEEEQSDVLDAFSVSPNVVRELAEIQLEHETLRQQLDTLIHRLHDSESPFRSWQEACDCFEELCDRLSQHETNEMKLQHAVRQGS